MKKILTLADGCLNSMSSLSYKQKRDKLPFFKTIIYLIVLFAVVACNTTDVSVLDNVSDSNYPITIKEAQDWFTQQIKQVRTTGGKQKRFDLNAVNWSNAVTAKYTNGRETIEILRWYPKAAHFFA